MKNNSYPFGEGKIGYPLENSSPSFQDSHHTGSALGKKWLNPSSQPGTLLMQGCLFLVVILWPQLEKSWTHVIEGFGTRSSSSKGSYRLDVMGEGDRWIRKVTWLGGHHTAVLWHQGRNVGMLLHSSESVDSESSQFLRFLLKLQSISFLSLFLSSFLSLLLSLSLFFYVIKIFALFDAIPDLIRRISLGIRG